MPTLQWLTRDDDKGALLAGVGNDETNEKRLVGEVWEQASDGKGLFAMIEKEVAGRNMREQLIEKLNKSTKIDIG